jgi:uncharacterized protein (AIM24 family)
MTDVDTRIACKWCKAQSPATMRTCDRCGAPLDLRDAVTDSGFRQTPRIRDLTELHWSESSVQLDTGVTPVAEITLAPTDTVFFEHHVMLWKDETVAMSVMNTSGGAKRLLGGMPFVLSVARGPGRVAFSRDAAGELVVLPIDPGMSLDVREHGLIMASGTLGYSFEKVGGLRTMLLAGTGMYLDRYVTEATPGLLILHGNGNVFQRTLGDGETIQVEPGGFLYKDASVQMEIQKVSLNGGEPSAGGAGPDDGGDDGGGGGGGGGGRFGKGLKGLKAARSALSGAAIAQAAGNLRSGGGIQGVAAGLAGGGGLALMRLVGPGRVGIQSMYQDHKSATEQ